MTSLTTPVAAGDRAFTTACEGAGFKVVQAAVEKISANRHVVRSILEVVPNDPRYPYRLNHNRSGYCSHSIPLAVPSIQHFTLLAKRESAILPPSPPPTAVWRRIQIG